MRGIGMGLLLLALACKSSGGEPIDQIAVDYCAACSELDSCERVVNETLKAPCPEETSAYYSCLTANSCDVSACTAEWSAREACVAAEPADGGADAMVTN